MNASLGDFAPAYSSCTAGQGDRRCGSIHGAVAASANQVETSPVNPRPPPLRLAPGGLQACRARAPPGSTATGFDKEGRRRSGGGEDQGDEVEGRLDEVG
jgi:hypothetical protein